MLHLLKQLFPKGRDLEGVAAALVPLAGQHQIKGERLAAFLAQVGHESGGLTVWAEILNYSAAGLAGTWPKRYRGSDGRPNELALEIARKPEQIANNVYANRMGNGDVASGDGWRYRGRGLIQLTGRDNYAAFAAWAAVTLEDAPAYLETPEGAVKSAVWFWATNKLSLALEAHGFDAVSRRINGGDNGMADRRQRFAAAKAAMGLMI